MIPQDFEQATHTVGKPADLEDTQCGAVRAYVGQILNESSLDGAPIFVTAWKPTEGELAALNNGGCVFIGFLCMQLPAHVVATDFHSVTNPRC